MSRKSSTSSTIPVIDLFAGPGGLGEGFCAAKTGHEKSAFKICLSIEKDQFAHETLELRSFFRQFATTDIPEEYYAYLKGELSKAELFNAYPHEARKAGNLSWLCELGKADQRHVKKRVGEALAGSDKWVLIGGPPCQAYSLAGRSRNKGKEGYRPELDHRHNLYQEYLKILAEFRPVVFVMENVKGLLSSKVSDELVFRQIIQDLSSPRAALCNTEKKWAWSKYKYRLYSITTENDPVPYSEKDPRDFIVECEHYGIPQTRHRVIIIGVREDVANKISVEPLSRLPVIKTSKILSGLPALRSGLSDRSDNFIVWREAVRSGLSNGWLLGIRRSAGEEVYNEIVATLNNIGRPKRNRGDRHVRYNTSIRYRPDWFLDSRLKGACNHSTRAHMLSDLNRYLYEIGRAHV